MAKPVDTKKEPLARAEAPAPTADRDSQTPAAAVRRAIVSILASGSSMTPKEIEQAVTLKLPGMRGPTVGNQLRVLEDGRWITASKEDTRRVMLTEQGERWALGIEALSPQR